MIVRSVSEKDGRVSGEEKDIVLVEVLSDGSYRTFHKDGFKKLHEPVAGFKTVVSKQKQCSET